VARVLVRGARRAGIGRIRSRGRTRQIESRALSLRRPR
jgi:hypothetical protein